MRLHPPLLFGAMDRSLLASSSPPPEREGGPRAPGGSMSLGSQACQICMGSWEEEGGYLVGVTGQGLGPFPLGLEKGGGEGIGERHVLQQPWGHTV